VDGQPPIGRLNGWTAARLDDLAYDVQKIKETLERMQAQEMSELRARVKEAESRPRQALVAFGAPLLAAVVSALVVVLTHVG